MMKCKIKVKTSMNSMNKKEHAVSPVIGVMLMIVVTIIIAAIVSAFAGDLSGGNDKHTAPMASIQCQIQKIDASDAVLTMKHLSGDSINTQYVRIIVSYTDSTGTPLQNRIGPGDLPAAVGPFTNSTSTTATAIVPYLTDAKVGEVGSSQVNFGTYVWTPGEIITTGGAGTAGQAGFKAVTGIDPTATTGTLVLTSGQIINVKLVDTNTQKTIMDQDVTVQ